MKKREISETMVIFYSEKKNDGKGQNNKHIWIQQHRISFKMLIYCEKRFIFFLLGSFMTEAKNIIFHQNYFEFSHFEIVTI